MSHENPVPWGCATVPPNLHTGSPKSRTVYEKLAFCFPTFSLPSPSLYSHHVNVFAALKSQILSLSFSTNLILLFHIYRSAQGRKVVTCSSITSLRSLGMASWCRCSCLSVMSSPPKCLWIGRQTKVNALVGKNDETPAKIIILSLLMFLPHFSTTGKLFWKK